VGAPDHRQYDSSLAAALLGRFCFFLFYIMINIILIDLIIFFLLLLLVGK
jgi:hypothetical protein